MQADAPDESGAGGAGGVAGGGVSRRRFLGTVGAVGAGAVLGPLAACTNDGGGTASPGGSAGGSVTTRPVGGPDRPAPAAAFPDGVMAGDPRPDGAIVWTRVAGDDVGADVRWEVAEDEAFSAVVASGSAVAEAAGDGAVKVAVTGLAADRWYHYRFTGPQGRGPVGRLRTAPAPGSAVEELAFAWCSCQQINDSLYVAHRAMAAEPDLDFFVHLGDYVYVSDDKTLTLDDYRGVYHRFKANPLLQGLQATVPIVAMYDDGEFYNGVDRTGDPTRLAAARRAWFEAFPVADGDLAHRSLAWGDLADLFVLDVRWFRDPAVEPTDTRTPEGAVVFDPSRTTLGSAQKSWLVDGLRSSRAAWRFLGNPYNMAMARVVDADPGPPRAPGAQVNAGDYFPNEAWDDYPVERREILQAIVDGGVRDVVSVSGHTHVWIAGVMQPDPDDPASPVAAFDLTCGSLTADPDVLVSDDGRSRDELRTQQRALAQAGVALNSNLRYINFIDQGYGLARVTPERATFEFKFVDPFDEGATPKVGARVVLPRGATELVVERFSDAER